MLATYDAHDPATIGTSGFHKDGEPVEHYSLTETAAEMAAVLRNLLAADDGDLPALAELDYEVNGPGMAVDARKADPAAGVRLGDPDPEPDYEGEFCAHKGVAYDTCTLHAGHEGNHLMAEWVAARGVYVVKAVWA